MLLYLGEGGRSWQIQLKIILDYYHGLQMPSQVSLQEGSRGKFDTYRRGEDTQRRCRDRSDAATNQGMFAATRI